LASPLLYAANPLPSFSPISSLVFLVKILLNGCPLYLRVLGLYSPRTFGIFPSLLMKKNLYSLPSFLWCSVGHERGRNWVFIAPFFLITHWAIFFSFLYNWSHTPYVFRIFLIWFLCYYIHLFLFHFISLHHSSYIHFFLILRILQRWWAFKPRPACLGLVLYIYIYIYIEGVDGKIYKQCGKWCVVCKTRTFQPPHGGQKIRAVPLLFKNKT